MSTFEKLQVYAILYMYETSTKLEISLSRGDTDTLTVIDVVTENDVVKT